MGFKSLGHALANNPHVSVIMTMALTAHIDAKCRVTSSFADGFIPMLFWYEVSVLTKLNTGYAAISLQAHTPGEVLNDGVSDAVTWALNYYFDNYTWLLEKDGTHNSVASACKSLKLDLAELVAQVESGVIQLSANNNGSFK